MIETNRITLYYSSLSRAARTPVLLEEQGPLYSNVSGSHYWIFKS
jgi:hypothetical protein